MFWISASCHSSTFLQIRGETAELLQPPCSLTLHLVSLLVPPKNDNPSLGGFIRDNSFSSLPPRAQWCFHSQGGSAGAAAGLGQTVGTEPVWVCCFAWFILPHLVHVPWCPLGQCVVCTKTQTHSLCVCSNLFGFLARGWLENTATPADFTSHFLCCSALFLKTEGFLEVWVVFKSLYRRHGLFSRRKASSRLLMQGLHNTGVAH